jgi:hypothetical protein
MLIKKCTTDVNQTVYQIDVLRFWARGETSHRHKAACPWKVLKEMLKSAIRRRCLVAVLEFVTVGIDYRAFLSGSVKGGDSHKSSFLWVLFFVSVSLVFGTLSNWQIQNIIIKLKKHHFIRLYCYAFFHNPISRKFSFIFFKKGLTNSNRFIKLNTK